MQRRIALRSNHSFLCSRRIVLYNDCITRIRSIQTCRLRCNYFTLRNAIVYRRHSLFGEYIHHDAARTRAYSTRQVDNTRSERRVPPMAQYSPNVLMSRVILVVYEIVAQQRREFDSDRFRDDISRVLTFKRLVAEL